MFEVTVDKTAKSMGNSSEMWRRFDNERREFETIEQVKEYLEQYKGHKRTKIYRDPNAEHVGYIYHFKNSDVSHAPVESWYQQDWVEISDLSRKPVIITP